MSRRAGVPRVRRVVAAIATALACATASWSALGSESPLPPEDPAESREPAEAREPPEGPANPRLDERVLRERTVFGTMFRGHFFIDGLPLSPDGLQVGKAIELRRARLSFSRQLPLRWEVLGSAELSSGSFELRDLYVRRRFDPLGTFTVGNQSEPMGLDELTSALSQPLLEPGLPTALVPGRNFGIMVGNRYGDLHYQAGAFGSGTQQEGRRDVGSGLSARLTHRQRRDDDSVRHLGVSISSRSIDGGERFRSVPEIGINQPFSVDTGSIDDADRTLRAGIEYLATFGRYALQAEWIAARVGRAGGQDLQFQGTYVEATWTAWGEGARYDDGDAVLTRAPVASRARWGDAWRRGNLALSARLSRIDLSDEDIEGGQQLNLTLGASWATNPRTRLAANLVHFIAVSGPSAEADGDTAIAVRYQYAF